MEQGRCVALVGRPNVGKSRLFNRLARRRIAIVHDQAGVTRDVNAAEVDNDYLLLDTGGIGLVTDMDHQNLIAAAEEQVWFAVEAARVICFLVDARDGLMPLDETIAARLRESGKRIILVVNKVDSPQQEESLYDFDRLGFEEVVHVSAEHGRNEEELRAAIDDALGPRTEEEASTEMPPERIKIAFVGRPNVGKSSICNSLLASKRLVVSEVPGTTRDAVALDLDYEDAQGGHWPFQLVDTAGLRKRGRVGSSVEYFSSVRSHRAIEEADVVFLVIDAQTGVTKSDKTLAGEIVDAGKCVALIVNKWDLALEQFRNEGIPGYESIDAFREAFLKAAMTEIFFLPDSPALFVSAQTGFSIDTVLHTAREIWERSSQTIPTPRLNRLLQSLVSAREPRHLAGKRFKVYYAVQTGVRPFSFRLFCNRATKLEDGYRRYLSNSLVREFGLAGCPVRFELRGKEVRYANKN